MDNRHNSLRHLDLAAQHYFMQVLGWMWSMVFSLSFLSIYNFGLVWMAHLLVFGERPLRLPYLGKVKGGLRLSKLPRRNIAQAHAALGNLKARPEINQ